EFSRRVVRKWSIRPKLWLINVDDQFVPFFSHSLELSIGNGSEAIAPLGYTRLRSLVNVIGRNLRWRIEDALLPLDGRLGAGPGRYRNVGTGDMFDRSYLGDDNPGIRLTR